MDALHGAVPLLQDYLRHSARRLPHKVALVCASARVSYEELDAHSNALAHRLRQGGVRRGDRVIIFADNTVETVVAFWAVLKASAVVSVVNPLTKRERLGYLLRDCRPAALITDQHLYAVFVEPARASAHLRQIIVTGDIDAARLARLPYAERWLDALAAGERAAPPPSQCLDIDLAAIIYTSGSTGDAKGVMLTHRNMLTACSSIASYLQLEEDEVILDILPLAFDYGLYQMLMAVRTGARLILERSFAFPAQVLNLVIAEAVTGFPGVPTMFAILAEMKSLAGLDFTRVRYVTSTAANLPVKHIHMLRGLFPRARIYSMYGLTECKRCTYLPPEDLERKSGSVGIAIPNTELWIVDEQGNRVGPGVTGQLVIRGATVMKGYWEKPEATAQRLGPGPLPGEQVLYTGDLCRLDEEGYLYFVARTDDIIKSRGEKVAPKEVENALVSVPGVREAAVVGVADELLGEAVKAFVVLEPGVSYTEQQLQKECQARLENFMVPSEIVFMPSLPRADSGKISKAGLK
jgi:amino acid adenylation domain-containing protein